MALVQAYRRTIPYTHTFPDVTLLFKPNKAGDVVCDVQEASAVERLLQTPTGFRLYGEQAPEEPSSLLTPAAPPGPAVSTVPVSDESPYVLKDEAAGDSLDLRQLDDAALQAFALANGVKVHPKAKGDTIRNKIVAAFKG